MVNVYFEDDVDIYFARQLVGERLQEAREQIPEGFGEPQMGPISTGMGLILFYYLEDTTGQYSLEELRTIQDWLVKFHLQTVPGVTEVLGIGGCEKQFQVVVDPEALLRYDVSLAERDRRASAPTTSTSARSSSSGTPRSSSCARWGWPPASTTSRRVVIKTDDGTPVFLRDLADVAIGGAIRRGVQTRNGVEEVVAGQVIKLFGTNSSTVIGASRRSSRRSTGSCPRACASCPTTSRRAWWRPPCDTVTTALLHGIVLVVIVLLVFMGGVRAEPRGGAVDSVLGALRASSGCGSSASRPT